MRDAASRETFWYAPRPRGWLRWLLDVALVVLVTALALALCRRKTVSCEWPERQTATCEVVTENAVGALRRESLAGIKSFAYRHRREVGFVTDAKNKDATANFGTRSIEMWDDASAAALEAFARERSGPRFSATRGPDSPPLLGAGLFALFALYVLATRRAVYALTVDRGAGRIDVREGGLFGARQSFDLDRVKAVEVERKAKALRVRLVLEDGARVPISPVYTPGVHHETFAKQVRRAMA